MRRELPTGKQSSLKGGAAGATTKMHAYVSADPLAVLHRHEDECFNACESHLNDLRTHHPSRLYPVLHIPAKGVPARYSTRGATASLSGSPAAMCTGN